MRLTCPNCSARYEVDDTMVPPEGRDVQCSNCATTWFQPGRRTDMLPTAVYVDQSGRKAEAEPEPEPEPQAEQTPEADAEIEAELDGDADAAADADAAPEISEDPAPVVPTRPARREIDPQVRDILREEAEREARLRHAEPEPVETQSEMSLNEDPDADLHARGRAELDEAQDAFADDPEPDHATIGARRDLLPDIEEINSTLRATGDRSPDEQNASDIETLDVAPRRRRSVRTGFLLVFIIAGLGVALYSNADLVAAQVPQAAPVIEPFVDGVNSARFWLDDMARSIAGGAG